MMRAFLFIFAVACSTPSFAAKMSRKEFHAQVENQVKAYNALTSTREWIEKAPSLSFAERAVMKKDDSLPATPPPMKVDFNGGKIKVLIDNLTVDFTDLQEKKQVQIKDVTLSVRPQDSVFALAGKIAQLTAKRKKASWNFWNAVFPEAHAEIDDTCIGRYEFMHRSPYLIFDTPAGYLPHLAISNLALTLSRQASTYLRNCAAQVKELNEIITREKIGLKEITCGTSDGSSSSNQIDLEFWTPESDGKDSLKTRSFSLDYSLGMAQEDPKNDEDEDTSSDPAKPKKKKKSKKPKKEAMVYIFGTSSLQEVRTTEEVHGEQECVYLNPKAKTAELSQKFSKIKAEMEPYRKVFEYFGTHDTCMACKKEVRLKVRSPTVPSHMASLVKKADPAGPPPNAGSDPNKEEEEEDDDETSTNTNTNTAPAK